MPLGVRPSASSEHEPDDTWRALLGLVLPIAAHIMKFTRLLLPWRICVNGAERAARGEDLAGRFAGQGEMILAALDTAPFPHPERDAGHRYENRPYSAKEHYLRPLAVLSGDRLT
jgi:hypothetical protein